jgi:hypothetical protein
MTPRNARIITVALLVALFLGTLMPGYWKDAALRPLHAPFDVSALAHVLLFALLAFIAPLARFPRLRAWHVPVLAFALALLTEGLQFLAIDRHPNLAGIAQDMTGALMGWLLSRRFARAPVA